MTDPDISNSHINGYFALHITHDVLLHLQQDMTKEGVAVPFTQNPLPVPNRQELEANLLADGYIVQGDTATLQTNWDKTSVRKTFLGRLRQLADDWTAPVISIPRQGTLEEYALLIDEALSHVASAEDQAVRTAMSARIIDRFVPELKRSAPQSIISLQPSVLATMSQPISETPKVATPIVPTSSPATDAKSTWADDFSSTPNTTRSKATKSDTWWDDFKEDESDSNFLTTSHAEVSPAQEALQIVPPTIESITVYQAAITANTDWESDFGESSPKTENKKDNNKDNWKKDFS